MTVLVDPPEGWRYGFPKVYDNPYELSFPEWLMSEGYPKNWIDQKMYKYCRFSGRIEDVDEILKNEDWYVRSRNKSTGTG